MISAPNITEEVIIKGTVSASESIQGKASVEQSIKGITREIPFLDSTLTKGGYAADAKVVGDALANKAPLSHAEDKNNPHGVTASQIGARPNTWMPTALEVGARPNTWMPTAEEVGAAKASHTIDKNNPHAVTAEQVGARPNTWMPTADDVGARPSTWMPTASDVGARPDTWTPTAEEVGARPDTWMPTATDVGAAPAGYGLGASCQNISDWNNAIESGFFQGSVNAPTTASWYGYVARHATGYVIQVAFTLAYGSAFQQAIRVMYGGTWKPWEYVNPPMSVGKEFRTTERYNGKPVYVKCVNIGALPNASRATLNTITAVGRETLISATGIATNGSDARPFPYRTGITTSGYGDVDLAVRTTGTQSITGYVTTTIDMSAFTGVLTLKYTKSTD